MVDVPPVWMQETARKAPFEVLPRALDCMDLSDSVMIPVSQVKIGDSKSPTLNVRFGFDIAQPTVSRRSQ